MSKPKNFLNKYGAPRRGGIVISDRKVLNLMQFPRAADPTPIHQLWLTNAGRTYRPNGKRERDRRAVQIVMGRLRTANGLAWPTGWEETELLMRAMQ